MENIDDGVCSEFDDAENIHPAARHMILELTSKVRELIAELDVIKDELKRL